MYDNWNLLHTEFDKWKKYIGQAVDLERRIYEHQYHMKRGTDKCTALQRAVNKYGFENFEFEILQECDDVSVLNHLEIEYISLYNSNNKNHGYNLSVGGDSGMIGYKHSEETRKKISDSKKGWVMGEEQRKFISQLHTGKIVSEETRKKMSVANTKEKHPMWGRKHTEESRAKMRDKKGGEKSYQFGKKMPNSASQYFGVYPLRSKGHLYWTAQIKQGKTHLYIGSSKIEEEAARMYDKFIIENGLPNPLNFE